MIEITFIAHSGETHRINTTEGTNLMQAALDNGVPGIDADCGGACACGTCHVIVASEWIDRVGGADDTELSMLQMTPERNACSRLACQINLDNGLHGLEVTLPEFQM